MHGQFVYYDDALHEGEEATNKKGELYHAAHLTITPGRKPVEEPCPNAVVQNGGLSDIYGYLSS